MQSSDLLQKGVDPDVHDEVPYKYATETLKLLSVISTISHEDCAWTFWSSTNSCYSVGL